MVRYKICFGNVIRKVPNKAIAIILSSVQLATSENNIVWKQVVVGFQLLSKQLRLLLLVHHL